MKDIAVDNFVISKNNKPFIIAEMSGNHNQSLDRALAIVDAAAQAGAHAIKLQTYTADTMTIKGAYKIKDENSLWHDRELYDLYKEAYTPWEWHKPIFDRAKSLGMLAFSSPFDETAVDFLESLNVPCYKIASFENTDWPLLKKVAATSKPIIMSTGVSNLGDIADAVDILKQCGCKDLILLKCTSTYPATPENTNILTIPHMSTMFDCPVGLSDHTMGIGVSIAAIALGARVIEKHFTLKRADGGVDAAFSLEVAELKSLVIESERAFQALGKVFYGIQKSEEKSKLFKRSIYIVKDIAVGQPFNKNNIKVIRPGLGLAPKYYEEVLSKLSTKDLTAGTPLSWEHVK